jgi:protein involved in polysaccharide export with SLBB domain
MTSRVYAQGRKTLTVESAVSAEERISAADSESVREEANRCYSRSCIRKLMTGIFQSSPALIAISISLALTSCETTVSSTTFSGQAAPPARVTLLPGDVVRLTFAGAPELNQAQKIRADGKLSLPLVGEVSAAGKTIGQLQGELAELYKSQLKTSEVSVSLESSLTTVVVSGAVQKPGKIVFERPTTVFQAIMESGGQSEFGNLSKVRLIRTINGVQHSQVMDLRPTLRGAATRAFYVRDGDIIYVPPSMF